MRLSIKFSFILVALLLITGSLIEISKSANAQEPEYYLSVNIVGNGVVTVNGSSPYLAGLVVNMTAYPMAGWEFTGWSGDLVSTNNPEYLTMDSNKSVTVTFTEIPVGGTLSSVNRVYLLFVHAWPIIIGVAGLIAGAYFVSHRNKRLEATLSAVLARLVFARATLASF